LRQKVQRKLFRIDFPEGTLSDSGYQTRFTVMLLVPFIHGHERVLGLENGQHGAFGEDI